MTTPTPKTEHKPGTILQVGGIDFVVCATINDLDRPSLLPAHTVAHARQMSGALELLWPLGVHVAYLEEGLLIGVFGFDTNKEKVFKISSIDFCENTVPEIGEVPWNLWKQLRDVSEATLDENFHVLYKESLPA